jgi:hypothetical protein
VFQLSARQTQSPALARQENRSVSAKSFLALLDSASDQVGAQKEKDPYDQILRNLDW